MKPTAQTIIIIFLACVMGFAGWLLSPQGSNKHTAMNDAWSVMAEVPWQSIDGQPKAWQRPDADLVLINYWASWCPSCIEEMPMLSEVNQELIPVHSIAQDAPEAVKAFLEAHPVSFTVWVEPPNKTNTDMLLGNQNNAFPYTLLVNRAGHVLATHSGPLDRKQIQTMVASAQKH